MIKPIAFAAALMAVSPAFAADLVLYVGQISVINAGAKLSTVVVGDSSVADVSVEGDSTVLVLARKLGHTDIVLLDQQRQVVHSATVTVAGTSISDHVTVRRMGKDGPSEERVMCAPGAVCAKADAK